MTDKQQGEGDNVLPPPLSDDDDDGEDDLPPPPSDASVVTPKLSLSDVRNAFPQEAKEETTVMDHIERTDPTKIDEAVTTTTGPDGQVLYIAPTSGLTSTTGGTSASSLLVDQATGLPSSFIEAMQVQKLAEMKEQEERLRMERTKSRLTGLADNSAGTNTTRTINRNRNSAKSTEDELAELTNYLLPGQSMEEGHTNVTPLAEGDEDVEEEELRPLTSAEKFAANAAGMIRHMKVSLGQRDNNNNNGGDNDGGDNSNRPPGIAASGLATLKQTNHDNFTNMLEVKYMLLRNRKNMRHYVQRAMLFLIIPCTIIALFLYYVLDNPGAEVIYVRVNSTTYERIESNEQPSYSWLFLFFGVRQVITYGLAVGVQYLMVSYYQQAGLKFTLVGPMVRLLIIQAKGWPLILFWWGVIDLMMLFGATRFANHWLYYQPWLGVFNDSNPSGGFPNYDVYTNIVIFSVVAGALVAVKRFVVGLRFGQNSYYRYADRLSSVLKEILIISKVSGLAEMPRTSKSSYIEDAVEVNIWLEKHAYSDEKSPNVAGTPTVRKDERSSIFASLSIGSITDGSLSNAQQVKVDDLLGEWEDDLQTDTKIEVPSLNAIVQFGSSVGVLESAFPFGRIFGYAKTRADVVDCAQHVYNDLLKFQKMMKITHAFANSEGNDPNVTLKFHTLALTALDEDGNLDTQKTKELMAVFRPTREGDITLIDFAKSVDTVYKEIRKIRASVANDGRMNATAESLINICFYFILVCVFLAALGLDPIVVFGGLSAFIISFSFCVSGASSDYVRGLLFILIQRPYDIGDQIAIANPDDPAPGNGSPQWTVKDVNLYYTTLVCAFSQEVGTLSNGSIALKRILNGARSPRANLHFFLKFGIRVKLETIDEFKNRLFEYVKSKPREWIRPVAFRLNQISADLGYTEYFVLLNHRESWQNVGALKNSLSDVQQFCFRLTSELGMGYESPALPVIINGQNTSRLSEALSLPEGNEQDTFYNASQDQGINFRS